jgi:hypothetical protein
VNAADALEGVNCQSKRIPMTHSTLLPTHKVSLSGFNNLASQLRQAGAKFRSSIHKSCATIVFSELPENARTILEDIANLQEMGEVLENIEHPINPEVEQVFESPLPLEVERATVEPREDSGDETRNISSPTSLEAVEVTQLTRDSSIEGLVKDATLVTEEQLLKLSKIKLKKLASEYNIEGRNKMEHHSLAAILADKMQVT